MKIRKILPLVLLALASVFLLSSCDALLDAIFSNDTITVYVSAYIPTYCSLIGPNTYVLSASTDTMTAVVSGTKSATATATYTGNDGYYMYWSVTIPQLSDGSYSVYVQYSHPYGPNAGTGNSVTQVTSLPAGNSHSVNLNFAF